MGRLTWSRILGWFLGTGLATLVSADSFAASFESGVAQSVREQSDLVGPNSTVLGNADQDESDMPISELQPFGPCTLQLDAPPKCWSYMINGRMLYKREAPWQAQIASTSRKSDYSVSTLQSYPLWELNHLCGGALISNDWIVTAAHCVVQAPFDKMTSKVRLGALDISVDDGATFSIDRVVVHQAYDAKTRLNDIALIKIKGAANFQRDRNGTVMMITLHGADKVGPPLLPWHPFQVTGWGVTSPGPDGHASARLQALELKRVPNDLCAQALRGGLTRIDASVLCAIAEEGDACQGDSGGPLTLTTDDNRGGAISILVGIVSWGRGCAIKGNPGVYTRISAHLNWIRRAIASADTVVLLK